MRLQLQEKSFVSHHLRNTLFSQLYLSEPQKIAWVSNNDDVTAQHPRTVDMYRRRYVQVCAAGGREGLISLAATQAGLW
jgi:hypothetical protein